MLLTRHPFLYAVIFLLNGFFLLSCVDIPADAPAAPVLNAEFRFISVNPSSVTTPAQFKMANGPAYSSFNTVSTGGNITPTAFTIYPAGSKKIIYQTDTTFVNFETDQKATVVFARNNEPDTSKKAKYFVLKMTLGYKFNPVTYRDTTAVRFVNLMRGGQDTIAVRQDSSTNASIVGSAVAFGSSSSYIKIAKGKVVNYFFTLPGNTDRVFKDSLRITATAGKMKTVFIYDSYDTSATAVNKIANVKIKEMDDN